MGIGLPYARLLLDEARRQPFGGSLLQLGRSFVYLRPDELRRLARETGVALAPVDFQPSHIPELAAAGCTDDRSFFGSLGFGAVKSCDLSDWEGADFLVDLNRPVPQELRERFDVVYDLGTLAHVFDQRTAFRNVFDLVAPGGRAIHGVVPSSNNVDIGFYMYCPTLFADFYGTNGWRIDTLAICEFTAYWFRGRMYTDTFKVYDYTPGALDRLRMGGLGRRQLGIFAVATKLPGATGDRVPMQGWYRDFYATQGARVAGEPAGTVSAQQVRQSGSVLAPPPGVGAELARAWKKWRGRIRRRLPPRMPPLRWRD